VADGIALIIPGISQGEADGRYVKRYVGATLAADTQARTVDTGATEYTLETYSGPVMGRMPSDLAPVLIGSGLGGQFWLQARAIRANADAGFVAVRFNGTPSAPTAVLNGQVIGAFAANSFDGTSSNRVASLQPTARETHAPGARGTEWRVLATPLGGASLLDAFIMRVEAGESVLVGVRAVTKILPSGGAGQLRNPSDTATRFAWDATGLGFYGVAPIARPTVTGSRAGNAAVASIAAQLAALGLVIDGTTA
jgi:hypothetical protein